MGDERTAIVWFRRDLRVHDHPALTAAARQYRAVVPVFVFDDALLNGRAASDARSAFLHRCLRALDEELRHRGSALVTRAGAPERVLAELARETGAQAVLWTSDVSPYARERDARVTHALRAAAVQARPHGGTYVVDVSRPRTAGGAPYHVFSPFFRRWRDEPRREVLPAPHALGPLPDGLASDGVPEAEPAGEPAARAAAKAWVEGPIRGYGERSTSRLSAYLRWGCLSARELEQSASAGRSDGAAAWVRQLCWRDL